MQVRETANEYKCAAVEKRTSAWMILKLVEQKECLWTTEEFHTWLHGLRRNLNS